MIFKFFESFLAFKYTKPFLCFCFVAAAPSTGDTLPATAQPFSSSQNTHSSPAQKPQQIYTPSAAVHQTVHQTVNAPVATAPPSQRPFEEATHSVAGHYTSLGNPPSLQGAPPPMARVVPTASGHSQGFNQRQTGGYGNYAANNQHPVRFSNQGGAGHVGGDVSDTGRIHAAPGFQPQDYETVNSMNPGFAAVSHGFPAQESTACAMGRLTLGKM